jgi:hypothetical protein
MVTQGQVNAQEEVVIRIRTIIDDVNKKFYKFSTDLKAQINKLEQKVQTKKVQAQIKSLKKELSVKSFKYETALNGLGVASRRAQTQATKLKNEMKKMQVPFAGYALSIMFFGMAMTNTFKTIAQQGISTFQDIMHSVEGSVTSFDILNGSLTYLWFVIGQALEPVVNWLIPIVDKVAEWISTHEELTASIIVMGLALGTLLTFGGMLKLSLDGFLQLGKIIAGMNFTPMISGISKFGTVVSTKLPMVSTLFTSVSNSIIANLVRIPVVGNIVTAALGGSFLATAGIIIAVILALYLAWKTNLGGMQEIFKNVFKQLTSWLGEFLLFFKAVFKGLLLILEGLFTGDFSKIMEGVKVIWSGTVRFLLATIVNLGAAILNIFIWVINTIIQSFWNLPRMLLSIFQWVAEKIADLFGIDLPRWVTRGFERGLRDIDALKKSLQIPTISAEVTEGFLLKEFGGNTTKGTTVINNTNNIQQLPGESNQSFVERSGSYIEAINKAAVATK